MEGAKEQQLFWLRDINLKLTEKEAGKEKQIHIMTRLSDLFGKGPHVAKKETLS